MLTHTTNDAAGPYITEIGGRNYAVDHEAGRIQFLDSRFYKCEDGSFVPSVTTVLEAYPKGEQFYEWIKKHGEDSDEIRDEAGRRGSTVHAATEILDQGGSLELMNQDGSPLYRLSEWAMIGRYCEFRESHPAEVHCVELKLASSVLGYAGTLDRLLTFRDSGKTYLVDIKTSGSVWPSYWLQQAAYVNLLIQTGTIARIFPDGEVPEVHLGILWLNAKTRGPRKDCVQGLGWQFVEQPKPTAELLGLFEKTHGLWMAENAGQQPRTTTYNLKHQLK